MLIIVKYAPKKKRPSLSAMTKEPLETDTETTLRETKEEVGLDVRIIDTNPIVMKYIIDKGTTEKIVLLFLTKLVSDSDGIVKLQDDKVAEVKWIPFGDFLFLSFSRTTHI